MNRSKWSRGVAVVGAGMSKFGTFKDLASRDLFVEAYIDLKKSVDKGFDHGKIEAFYLGNFSSDLFEKQSHLAPILANWVGLSQISTVRIEDACASGGAAFRQAALAIASGEYNVVLVGGVEKMTDLNNTQVTEVLATAADTQFENPAGFTFPGFYAAMATAYMAEYHAKREAFCHVSIKNHENGALNSKAQFGKTIHEIMENKKKRSKQKGQTIPDWKNELEFLNDPKWNPFIAWPMTLFDCSPVTDGGAAVLLVADEIATEFSDSPLYLIGSGQASDGALPSRSTLTSLPAAEIAGKQAFKMSGLSPQDIDLAEVHDCFTIAEIMATEDLGFFQKGEGWRAALDQKTTRDGLIPINPSGGLKSKGHPVGASGLGQINEIWEQLHEEAGNRQIQGQPRLGLTHNVGGSGQTCVVNIFERRE